MVKKVFYWVLTIIQAVFLIAACGIQYFSMKKMGMMRYVLYINREWEAQYPIASLKYVAIACLVLLSIGIVFYVKTNTGNHFTGKKILPPLITELVVTLAFVFFTLLYSTESYRAYYFISITLAIAALIQSIKILIFLKGPDSSQGAV